MSEKTQDKSISYGLEEGPCAVCGEPGRPCGRCRNDFYCNKQHQTQHWPQHKQGCGCLKVRETPELGRHLVVTKSVPAGTVLLRETPLIVYPRQVVEEVKAICVGCGRLHDGKPQDMRRCKRCNYPVCGEACSRRPEHRAECAAFESVGFKVEDVWITHRWHALGVLRYYLAMQEKQGVGPRLLQMQSDVPPTPPSDPARPDLDLVHEAIECTRGSLAVKGREALEWLKQVARLKWLDDAMVLRAQGVMFYNCGRVGLEGHELLATFAGLSLVNHACAPNAVYTSWADHNCAPTNSRQEHLLVAARDIKAGEALSFAYTDTLFESKPHRRQALVSRWGFYCRCSLCEDPTHGGLHLESFYCANCKGAREKRLVRVADGLLWRCAGCGRRGLVVNPDSDAAVKQAIELEKRMRAMKAAENSSGAKLSMCQWELLLRDALWPRGPLHPTSFVVLQAKNAASNLPKAVALDGTAEDFGTAAGYCRELLAALDALSPGGHPARSELQAKLLINIATEIAVRQTELASMRGGSRAAMQASVQRIQTLKEEGTGLLAEMEKAAVTPVAKNDMKMHALNFTRMCTPNFAAGQPVSVHKLSDL